MGVFNNRMDINRQVATVLVCERAYATALFIYSAWLQCLLWMPLAAAPAATINLFPGFGSRDILNSLNWGPIMQIACTPIAVSLLDYPRGLSQSMRVGVLCSSLCAGLRLVAAFLPLYLRRGTCAHLLLHAAGLVCGVASPFTQGSPSRFSAVWFPPAQRARATAACFLSCPLGLASGYAIAPLIVCGDRHLASMLVVHAALAVPAALCVLWHCPVAPTAAWWADAHAAGAQQATASAEVDAAQAVEGARGAIGSGTGAETGADTGAFVPYRPWCDHLEGALASAPACASSDRLHIRLAPSRTACTASNNAPHVRSHAMSLARNFSFWLVALLCGLANGPMQAWMSALPTLLQREQGQRSLDAYACASMAAYSAGAYVFGELADRLFRSRLKRLLLWCQVLALGALVFLTLTLPSPWRRTPPLQSSTLCVAAVMCAASFLVGGTAPLCLELAAQITYPVPEGYSANVVSNLSVQLATIAFLALTAAPSVDDSASTSIVALALCGCVVLLLPVREVHRRADAEAKLGALRHTEPAAIADAAARQGAAENGEPLLLTAEARLR